MSETPAEVVAVASPPPRHPRPLSPHLQIYRPQITSVMSILHRITGVALAFGALALVALLAAAAQGPEAFAVMQGYAAHPVAIVMMMGWSWALMYHLCTGLRHLVWDMGWCFTLEEVYVGGYLALIVSSLLTLGVWVCVFARLS